MSIETMEQEAWGVIMEHPRVHGLSEWRPLACGSRSVVWAARQLTLDRPVAVKVYQRELDEGDRRRFLREAAAARLSDHPGIVTTHDAGILPDDRPYLIMDLCSGGSLTQWLKPENRPSEEQVRQVGARIADALAAVHARGVLHRDVKPANILIDSFGNPALADFGLAAGASTETAAADEVCVTPAYAPPEAFGMQPATESGDVFSLAATLYALLAGRPPRDVGAAAIDLEQTVEVAKRPIGPIPGGNRYLPIPGVNRCLMDVLMTALSNDPLDRPTAAIFRDQLANVPEMSISKRGAHLGADEDTSSVFSRGGSLVSGHSATSNSHSIAVKAVTDSHRAPDKVASDEAQRRRGKRRVVIPALAAALVAVIAPTTVWLTSEPAPSAIPATTATSATSGPPSSSAGSSQASDPGPPTATTTPGAGGNTRSGSAQQETIQLENSANAAKPFQTVRIQGTYRGGADTTLRVQRLEGGQWLAFPLPTKTDKSGQFTAYVEFGKPGLYQLRVLDPDSDLTSKPSVLVIEA
ncbi:MAG TPA: serine/threonine-protein kinase [Propionibacteriaceae bacterium]|nr:serine/threonine-protein kinase [Propionibacteriaceae bacterium]